MCAYTVIIGDTVPIVLRAILGLASTPSDQLSFFLKLLTDRRVAIVLCSYGIILPVSSVRNISSLAKFSIFALFALLMIALSIVIAGSHVDPSLKGTDGDLFSIIKIQGIAGAIGTLSFAYVCHHNCFIIFKSLKFPTMKNYDMVNSVSLGFACLASLFIGISGYVIFGSSIKSNVLNCFSDTDGLVNFARFCFALDMFLTYPLELFIARNTLFRTFLDVDGETVSDSIHMGATIGLVTLTTLIGVSTCNLGVVLDLTGGFFGYLANNNCIGIAASAIAFIFPSACSIRLNGGRISDWRNWKHLACVSFGIFVLILTIITTLIEVLESPELGSSRCKFANY